MSPAETTTHGRAANLRMTRKILGWIMTAYTAALAVLWAIPAETGGQWWLVCLAPGAGFVALVWKATRVDDNPPSLGTLVKTIAILVVGWFGGFFLVDSGGAGDGKGIVTDLWLVAHVMWPFILTAMGVTRFILSRLEPSMARRDVVDARRREEIERERRLHRESHAVDRPSMPGRMSGYEPAQLSFLDLPAHQFSVGFWDVPHTAGFARALHKAGLYTRFATFWSPVLGGVVADCVIVTGSRIIVVEVEDRVQGDVTWLAVDGELRMVDNPTGGYVGGPQPLSDGLQAATEALRETMSGLGVGLPVTSVVAFLPTDQGIGNFEDVHWPGGAPALAVDAALDAMAKDPDFSPVGPVTHAVRALRSCVESQAADARAAATHRGPIDQPRVLASCPACGVVYEDGTTYCLSCGQVRS